MLYANLEEDLSDFLSTIDQNEVCTAPSLPTSPAAHDVITTVFQEAIRPTLLAAPEIPRNEAVSTPLPSQNIAQEYKNSPGNDD
jgi:hypothetical protein